MLLKINNLRYIINFKHALGLCLVLLFVNLGYAQEIIEDEVEDEVEETFKKVDTIKTKNARKVDGVAAVIGDYIVLDSDIDKTFLQLKAQGVNTDEIESCQLFGKLLEDKLYAHHAVQDSIIVPDAEIRRNVDYQIQQFLQQTNGSMERLISGLQKGG